MVVAEDLTKVPTLAYYEYNTGNSTAGWMKVMVSFKNPLDLNKDGKISAADIQIIINEMKKPQAQQNMKYDLNGDNKVSAADIQIIINEMKK